jgi:superfamily II DNA or RNA helicase
MEALGTFSIAPLPVVKATIAQLVLERSDNSVCVGRIQLKQHQASAAARLRQSIREFGGAILCDPVGTGKTFTALALPGLSERLAVVAPAVLRQMWLQSLVLAGRKADFISFESLSRGSSPVGRFDFVIVDEAHHARNSRTARFTMLSKLLARAEVILLTATPIHNRRRDLITLLSLFLGERAASLTKAQMSRCVIRRDDLTRTISGMPSVDSVEWVRTCNDPRVPELLLSLPPPVPLRDGGDGGVLVALSLIRQWASSNAALIGGLRRRLVRAEALAAALADGTRPGKTELLSWMAGEDAVQLGLPGLLASEKSDTKEMIADVRRHTEALRSVLDVVKASHADEERCETIRKLRESHNNHRIVAFSQYSDTVGAFFTSLSRDGQVAVLSGSGGRVAGGVISRFDALAAFAPEAMGGRPVKRSDEIRLLLATDLVSEGVNLQDAGVLIHLDLPWTVARMEQRLGRIARIGSRHETVRSYAFLPPASAGEVVRIERILRKKMEAAGLIEGSFPSLAGWLDDVTNTPDTKIAEETRDAFRQWMAGPAANGRVAAVVSSGVNGFLAVAVDGALTRTIVQIDDRIGESPQLLQEWLSHCDGPELTTDHELVAEAEAQVSEWLLADNAVRARHYQHRSGKSVRASAVRRVQSAVRRAPLHQRARIAASSERALEILDGNLGFEDEMQIGRLCATLSTDETILDRIVEIGRVSSSGRGVTFEVKAIIVLTRR